MARKKAIPSQGTASIGEEPVQAIIQKLPEKVPSSTLRFLGLVVLSLTLSSLGYSAAAPFLAGDLSGVSRRVDEWWQVVGLLGWRGAELAVGWWGGYDDYDLAALTLLTHFPPLYLLVTFYDIRPPTFWFSLIMDVVAVAVPFRLLRQRYPYHSTSDAPKGTVANRSVITDSGVRFFTAVLGALIYAVGLFISFKTSSFRLVLARDFTGLRSLSAAYEPAVPGLFIATLVLGAASSLFIFTPAIGAKRDEYDDAIDAFNPEEATFSETLAYNIWGWHTRTRTLMKRTLTLAAMTALNTWLQLVVTVEGTDAYGSTVWAIPWVVSALVAGASFWWSGDVEGISN